VGWPQTLGAGVAFGASEEDAGLLGAKSQVLVAAGKPHESPPLDAAVGAGPAGDRVGVDPADTGTSGVVLCVLGTEVAPRAPFAAAGAGVGVDAATGVAGFVLAVKASKAAADFAIIAAVSCIEGLAFPLSPFFWAAGVVAGAFAALTGEASFLTGALAAATAAAGRVGALGSSAVTVLLLLAGKVVVAVSTAAGAGAGTGTGTGSGASEAGATTEGGRSQTIGTGVWS
jgi:hypothetical protein